MCVAVWALYLQHTKVHRGLLNIFQSDGPGSAGVLGVFVFLALVVVAALVAIVIVIPTLLYSVRTASRPWKKWYTALLGGLAAQTIGIVVAVCVYAIIRIILYFS